MIHPLSSMFNIGGTVTIYGDINIDILKKAILMFIASHDSFQIRLINKDGHPEQIFDNLNNTEIDYIDFYDMQDGQSSFETWVHQNATDVFSLYEKELFKFWIYRLDGCVYGYMVKMHHIIADGWSMQMLTREISNKYTAILTNAHVIQETKTSYVDYIEKEKKYLASIHFETDKEFWNKLIEDFPENYTFQCEKHLDGRRQTVFLSINETEAIRSFCSLNNISINSFFVGLYILFIYKTTGQKDIVIGNPVFGRVGKKDRNIFGMFVGSMPFFYCIDENKDIVSMFQHVHASIQKCFIRQRYPYNYLVKDAKLSGTQSFYTSCINYYNTEMCHEFHGYPVENKEFYNGQQDYDLQIIIREWTNTEQMQIDIDYKTKLYNEADIDSMTKLFIYIINAMMTDYPLKLQDFSLLNKKEEEEQVFQYNNTACAWPHNCTVVDLWEEQAIEKPECIAVTDGVDSITYGKLMERTRSFATILQQKGISHNTIVGLYVSHSINAIIGILGIMKAGGTYLPIEKTVTVNRIQHMLLDASVEFLVVDSDFPDEVGFSGVTIDVSCESSQNYSTSSFNAYCLRPSDLAYILYTSGSTGVPKGVMIEHHSLLNYIYWAKTQYVNQEGEVFPLYSSLAFDLTITSIFTPLISGGTISIYRQDDEDEHVIFRILRENKCTIIKLTPAHLRLISEGNHTNSSVNKLIVGGEDLTVDLARATYRSFGGQVTIYNEYGPTEATIGCMIYRFDEQTDLAGSVPIGKPIANSQIYVLDQNLNPVPVGIRGELYIGGQGVARGYLNQPILTRKKFVNKHCFGDVLYSSGDIVEFLSPQTIIYRGRMDQQLKINGYRIELGEIEYQIKKFSNIKNAVVVPKKSASGKRLCAYYLCDAAVDESALKQFLYKTLPTYMIPADFVLIDTLPLTKNGKVDWDQLPDPASFYQSQCTPCTNMKTDVLMGVVSSVMKLEAEPMQNFFHLGGDSIQAIQISSKLSELGYYLKVKNMLENPIFSEMSTYMNETPGMASTIIASQGNMPHTPMISWLLSHYSDWKNSYGQIAYITLKRKWEKDQLLKILQYLIQYHDALRLQCNSSMTNIHFIDYEKCKLPDIVEYTEEYSVNDYAKQLLKSIDLTEAPLIRSCLVYKNGETIWLIAVHHIAIDAVSWKILFDDLYRLLIQNCNNTPFSLPEKTVSYKQWALLLQSQSEHQNKNQTYWEVVQKLAEETEPILKTSQTVAYIEDGINEINAKQICFDGNMPYNIKMDELLLAAFVLAIGKSMARKEIIIEMESHGRLATKEEIDLSRTLGWFTSMYPLPLSIDLHDIKKHIMLVKETIRQVPMQGVGYSLCKLINHWQGEKKWLRFNYLGKLEESNEMFSVDLSKSIFHTLALPMTCQAEVISYVKQNKLYMIIKYPDDEANKNIMQNIMRQWISEIENIFEHCKKTTEPVFTPSDFAQVDLTQEELDSLFK